MSNSTPTLPVNDIRITQVPGSTKVKISFWQVDEEVTHSIQRSQELPPELAEGLLKFLGKTVALTTPRLDSIKNIHFKHNPHGGLTMVGDIGGNTTYNKPLSHIASGEIKAIFADVNQVFDAIKS